MWRLAMAPAAMPEPARRPANCPAVAGGHHAAAGMQHQEVAGVAALLQRVVHALHVAAHHGAQDRVHHRRREAFVLEDFGQSLGRRGDLHAGKLLHQDLLHARFVLRVDEGVHEADGDGLDTALAQNPGLLARIRLVQRGRYLSAVVDPLAHGQPVPAPDVGLGHVFVRVPEVLLVGAPDLDDVPVALGADHRGGRQAAGNQRVGGNGRAVGEEGHVLEIDLRLFQPPHRADQGVVRRRCRLCDPERA